MQQKLIIEEFRQAW